MAPSRTYLFTIDDGGMCKNVRRSRVCLSFWGGRPITMRIMIGKQVLVS